jgi:hypothetical protein
MSSLHETLDDTRRCLFPAAADGDVSFECDLLNSEQMIKATDPDSSLEQGEEGKKQKLPLRDSPVGVADLFPQTLCSMIHVDENGAEVTLGFEKMSMTTPERGGNQKLTCRSLLDTCTPTPTPPPIKSNRDFVNGWCGNPSVDCVADDTYELPSAKSLEELITSLLGDGENATRWNGCSIWQEWSLSVDPASEDKSSGANSPESLRLTDLRLRALSLKTRQQRVQQMRRDLHPFENSPARTPILARSRSLTVSDPASTIERETTETRQQSAAALHPSSWLCTLPENGVSESPLLLRYNTVENPQVCYDSDPEDFARSRSPKRARRDEREPSISTEDAVLDQELMIQEFMNQSFTLIYHPSPRDDEGGRGPSCPIAMDAWLERGQILKDLIQPKWLFRPKSRQAGRKGTLVNAQIVKSVELLSITRILALTVVDRQVYPFAKPFKSFVVRNIEGEDFCFEAQSTKECEIIVFSLKLAIARFGAMVITANHQVYTDFFASIENCVPGEAPQIENLLSMSMSVDSEEDY